MSSERGPEYYEEHLERVLLPLERSPWLEVYQMAVSLLPRPGEPIADLGCGTGRFARLLWDHGYRDYWGVDFSPARIREARRYVPQMEFSVGSLFDDEVRERYRQYRFFTLIEVLEHIRDDLGLLASLPSGSFVVFSVPNYGSAGHVRCFPRVEGVIERYKELLDFSDGQSLVHVREKRPHKKIFVLSARRR